jgi:hypothetical protein
MTDEEEPQKPDPYVPGEPWRYGLQPWLYICERCGDVFRDDMPHAGDLSHICPDGQEGRMVKTEDDGRELPMEQDAAHPDNPNMWMA